MLRPADRPHLPRLLHPLAWWLWAGCLAAVASRTTNPFVLVLVVVVVGYVVVSRRELGAPSPYLPFLLIGLTAIVLHVLAQCLLGGGVPGRVVLFQLPEVPLPDWFGRIRLGGPVTAEELLFACYEGARLAAVLACVGAANALASPRRLLRHVPATLYEVGTAVVVALTYAPQLVDDARRVRAARRLRGHAGRSPRELARLMVPVLEGALDRSLQLAASMESRGYGRSVHRTAGSRRAATALTLTGLGGVVAGLYGVLDASAPPLLGFPLVVVGLALAVAALLVGARRERRSRYRPDPWALPEWLVLATGLVALGGVLYVGATDPGALTPQSVPAEVPAVPVVAAGAVLLALLAGVAAPCPPVRAARQAAARRGSAPPATAETTTHRVAA